MKFKFTILTLSIICFTYVSARASLYTADTLTNSSLQRDTMIPPAYEEAFESLMETLYLNKAILDNCERTSTTAPTAPDSIYTERLLKLPYTIPMPFNTIVRSYIEMYLRRNNQVEYMLGLGNSYYFPIFEAALSKYDLPLELKYLPVIESALNAQAISHAGAGGLWQFMVATGRSYGLEVNSLVDERCDPIKATDAAARYLKDLYGIYGDWHLAIAAYNCGPGNVAKAIRYANGKRDYWSIYPYLPRETRGYVPIFIAANYVMHYHTEHNICPARPNITSATDTLMVKERIHLQQIADLLPTTIEELRFLNPQYRRDIIPGNIKPYPLVLPISQIGDYIANKDTIVLHRAAELVAQQARIEPAGHSSSVSSGRVIYYKVRSGDNLGKIAAKYGTTVSKLKQWNGIKGTVIRTGQRLKIYK